jgi:hypothetical protein
MASFPTMPNPDEPLMVPSKMPKAAQMCSWPVESVFYKSHLFMYEDIRAMMAEDYPFMRDTILISTVKFISAKDRAAVTCVAPSLANTLAVWDYVNKHDDVITGAIFKAPREVGKPPKESKLSKEAIKDATKTKCSGVIPVGARSDHPGQAVKQAPQQIVVWGYNFSDNCVTGLGTEFSVLLNAMSQAQARIPILVITKGAYGRFVGETVAPKWTDASSMAMWGLIRTARQEIPNIAMLGVDIPYGTPSSEIGKMLLPSDAEQLYYHGVKFLPQIEQIPSLLKKAQGTPGNGQAKSGEKPMFARKMFNWGRPESKLDNVWFRQKFIAVGPAHVDVATKPGVATAA